MLKEIEKQIEQIKEKIDTDERIRERLTQLGQENKVIRRKFISLQKILDKEYEDVKALEKTSVNALFVRVLGDRDEQMDRERQEYLEAYLNLNALLKEKELIEYEIELLKAKLVSKYSLEESLERLYLDKEQALKAEGSSVSKRLFKFDQEIGKFKLLRYNIEKAIDQGKQSQNQIQEIYSGLKKVVHWGFGGYADTYRAKLMKKNYVEEALENAVSTQRSLNQYSAQIETIFPDSDPQFKLDQFKIFVQTLVHHLVSDWIVERRIKMAFHGLEITADQVTLYLYNLQHEYESCNEKISKIEDEKRMYVENL